MFHVKHTPLVCITIPSVSWPITQLFIYRNVSRETLIILFSYA